MSRVAFLGIEGSFSSIAAREISEPGDTLHGYSSFTDVFKSVSSQETDKAVVPIENSIAGTIHDNLDLIREYPLSITAEHYLPVELSLIVLNETVRIEGLREVLSHQKAIEQCGKFFKRHADIDFIKTAVSDTAVAALKVSEAKDPSVAAIADKQTAPIFGLTVLETGIQDVDQNFTRFVKIESTNEAARPANANKCSIVLDLPHRPGALLDTVSILSEHGHNIMTIMTRPIPGRSWEYLFYIDFVSEVGQSNIDLSLAALKRFCNECRSLGVYENKSPMSWLNSDKVTISSPSVFRESH